MEVDNKKRKEYNLMEWKGQNDQIDFGMRYIIMRSRNGRGCYEEKCNLHFLQIANSDKPVAYYSLDVIISVGYRVKSKRGVEFRK